MRTYYQEKKKELFDSINGLRRGSKKRKELQKKFNGLLPRNQEVEEEEDTDCQKCGGSRVGQVRAGDEYYDICKDCGFEQSNYSR